MGAIYRPLASIVPAVEGLTLQFKLEFPELPVTVAVNCQFAPAPICEGKGAIVTPSFWVPPPLEDDPPPPQPTSGKNRANTMHRTAYECWVLTKTSLENEMNQMRSDGAKEVQNLEFLAFSVLDRVWFRRVQADDPLQSRMSTKDVFTNMQNLSEIFPAYKINTRCVEET